jgi:GT2 family glycosyltransferase
MSDFRVNSIYVSHNSEKFINRFAKKHINELGDKVYIINSSPEDFSLRLDSKISVLNLGSNVGFSVANNIGIKASLENDPDFILIINPDVYLPGNWLNKVMNIVSESRYSDVGIFTVPLYGYDFNSNAPTGLVDSAGVYSTWYGRWYDDSMGVQVNDIELGDIPYDVPAACGALMILRTETARLLMQKDGYIFNESYFMYKEDIELSIRVRDLNKRILLIPSCPVFHCRGWDGNRRGPYWSRRLSARNELSMHFRHRWRYIPFSLLKYLYVKYFEYAGRVNQ